MTLERWALPQLSRLLPLDEDSLKQIIQYSEKLSPNAAAQHLKELIGDSSQALEFIASFNSRRRSSLAVRDEDSDRHSSEIPKPGPRKKKVTNANKLPPVRLPENYGISTGGYLKKEQEDYMPAKHGASEIYEESAGSSSNEKPNNKRPGKPQISSKQATNAPLKLPPSASGPLISDVATARSSPSSSSSALKHPLSTNKSQVKVNIPGGTPMHGKSTLLNDLDSAIRSLEVQTNPTLVSGKRGKAIKQQQQQQQQQENKDKTQRRCDCMATRHPLLTAAPNCLNCGKIICVSEGLGPCTFCDQPLLSSSDLHSMLRVLREERGRERTNVHNASHKRANHVVPSSTAARKQLGARSLHSTPISSAPSSDAEGFNDDDCDDKINGNAGDSIKLTAARHHRDKLLAFQAQNSQRTRVHDEAAEYDTPIAGLSMWASPQERALQLKQQQRVLREQEWNARPEYEKRRVVVSVDLVGGKVVKRMAEIDRPAIPTNEEMGGEGEDDYQHEGAGTTGGRTGVGGGGGGAFSRNPLLGSLIKPVIENKGKSAPRQRNSAASTTWRRVQDDNDDNEQLILEGRLYGGEIIDRSYRQEETVY